MDELIDSLWLSSVTEISDASIGQLKKFDHVVGVCHESRDRDFDCTYDYYNMSDGAHDPFGDASQETFNDAVNSVVDALTQNESVLVHCQAGQSRSVAVAAAALARYNDHHDVQHALEAIRDVRDTVMVERALLKKAEKHIEIVSRHEH